MSAAPLAAICTPVYNGEKHLAETMECVQAQTYPNLVHVILDNASTDSTPEILARYQGGRVPLILGRNPETVRVNENLNRVMAMMPAEASYFCLLCADDLMYPTAMERMIDVMERYPSVGLVATAEPNPRYLGWPPGEVFDGLETVAEYFRAKRPTAFARCVFRKALYDRRAPQFYDPVLNNCDVDVGLALMCETDVGYVHDPQCVTREHEESITSSQMDSDKIHFAEWLIFLQRYGEAALGAEEARRLERRFKRFYYRRLLRWRFAGKRPGQVERHLQRLESAALRPSLLEYLDAVADWPLLRLGVRPAWDLYPQW